MNLSSKLANNQEKNLRRLKRVGLAEIVLARETLRPIIHETPLIHSRTFSELSGNDVYLKMENLQKTGAFKIRGAANKVFNLSPEEAARGVIAASAGNHAQGVAWAATVRGIPATIVMPKGAPTAKIMATRGYGGEVILHGQTYDEAYQYARLLQQERGQTFVHAFDDPQVIAGQGTIALEIIDQLPDVEAMLVPIGGGGLVAGMAIAAKELNPKIRVIGVQSAGAPSMYLSRQKNSRQQLQTVKTIADGIAVKEPGQLTFKYVQKYVDDIVLVEEADIADSIITLLERGKVMAEGAGVVGLAALLAERVYIRGAKVAVVLSGGNMDPVRLSQIITGAYI
ncbi:MAG: threonine ammonia-lyase [Firmicutes bacterium]|nr:threonine ammonia-lyase [Bacillota bacterium]